MIDITSIAKSGKVLFGTTIVLINLNDNREVIYKIVGDDEADIKVNKISVNSPIARALIGKEEGMWLWLTHLLVVLNMRLMK